MVASLKVVVLIIKMLAGFPKVIFQAVKIPALLAGDAKLNPSLMNILSQPKKWSSVEGYPPDRVQSCQTSRLMVSLGPLGASFRANSYVHY